MYKDKNPVIIATLIFFLCYIFRTIEYFIVRTDKTLLSEAFIHKLIGIVILFVAIKMLSFRAKDIGFSRGAILKHSLWGFLFGICVFIIAYGVEIMIAVSKGIFQSVDLYVSSYAVDGNIGNQTQIIFFLICIIGNVINVVMEEGMFRGLFQKVFEKKYTFISSAIIASILFGLWHAIGPVRNYYDELSSVEGMAANLFMLVLTSGLVGFKFALLTKLTGSLYMAMGDHFVNNTVVNILHVVTQVGADELMFVRITIAQTLSIIIVLVYYFKRKRLCKDYEHNPQNSCKARYG
jgi:membrane protease YdiL (CAAX protease family)